MSMASLEVYRTLKIGSLIACAAWPHSLEAQGSSTQLAVPYVVGGTSEQVMDVFWPNAIPAATVLFIHGGSLQESGERRTSPEYRDVCTGFVEAGIACASMDYRLAPTHAWPAMSNDVAAAVVKLRSLVSTRRGDPGKVFLFGHSSGCHLAAIVGTNKSFLESEGLETSDIAGIIAMGCTLDRDDATLRGLTPDMIRRGFMSDDQDVRTFRTPENYLAANPASFLGPHVPSMLVLLADGERFMPPIMEQGARVVRVLLEHDVAANMIVVPGNHMSSVRNISRDGDPGLVAILRFIRDPKGSAAAH